jgi:hypothetical protein
MHIEKLYAFICLFIYIYRFGLQHKKKKLKKNPGSSWAGKSFTNIN